MLIGVNYCLFIGVNQFISIYPFSHCCDEYLIPVQLKLDLFDWHWGVIVFLMLLCRYPYMIQICRFVIMQVIFSLSVWFVIMSIVGCYFSCLACDYVNSRRELCLFWSVRYGSVFLVFNFICKVILSAHKAQTVHNNAINWYTSHTLIKK